MQEILMNKIIPISKKARKKLRLARYPALGAARERLGRAGANAYRGAGGERVRVRERGRTSGCVRSRPLGVTGWMGAGGHSRSSRSCAGLSGRDGRLHSIISKRKTHKGLFGCLGMRAVNKPQLEWFTNLYNLEKLELFRCRTED
jgi:hypothetical protein